VISVDARGPAPRFVGNLPLITGVGALLLGVVATVLPAAAVALVAGLGFVLIAFRSLAAGLALFTLLISVEQVPSLASGLTFVKLGGGVLAAAWVAQIILRRRDAPLLLRERPWISATAICLIVWSLASSLWAADSEIATSSALRLSQGIFLLFIVYSGLREPRHVRWLLGAYVVGALLAAGFGIVSGGGGEDPGRLAGGVGNPNELAGFLLPALMVCIFMLIGGRRGLLPWASAVAALLLLLALLMTGSRGGLAGLAVALAAAILLAGPARVRIVAVALMIFGVGGAYYLTSAPAEQIDRISSFTEDGGTGRTDLWAIGAEMTRDHPLTGVGAGNFSVAEPEYATRPLSLSRIDLVLDDTKVAHNTYLSFLSQLGFVGLALFATLVIGGIVSGLKAVRRLREHEWQLQQLTRGFVVGFVGMLAAFTFSSADYQKHLWLLLGVAVALPSLTSRGTERERPGVEREDDYHQLMDSLDPDGQFGQPDSELLAAEGRRLARRRAALEEREQVVARREEQLRGRLTGAPADQPYAEQPSVLFMQLASRLARVEAEIAEAPTNGAPSREDFDVLRAALEDLRRQRVVDTERLAAAEALAKEAEERADEQQRIDEERTAKLRAKLKQLQQKLKQVEVERLSLGDKLAQRKQELDRRERDLAQRERQLAIEDD